LGGSKFEANPGKLFVSLYLEETHHRKRASRVAQGEGPEFKPQYHKKKKKSENVQHRKDSKIYSVEFLI
jgi:hypothetical protein